MVSKRSRMSIMTGKAYVDGTLVAEAELSAMIVDRAIPEEQK
jgi:3-hydroxymyristoyl/3-hydroxydecanoyl-(acyl carrier protein) dehydratase